MAHNNDPKRLSIEFPIVHKIPITKFHFRVPIISILSQNHKINTSPIEFQNHPNTSQIIFPF